MSTYEVLATFGHWQARYQHSYRRYYVVDLTTGIEFGANSKAHAIYKARQNSTR